MIVIDRDSWHAPVSSSGARASAPWPVQQIHLSRGGIALKYLVQVEIDPDVGLEIEANMETMQSMLGVWQALNPIGMYFAMTRRAVTIIVDVPNEDAMFEALHATWDATSSYPEVWPVGDATEFPAMLQRAGVGPPA